MEDNMTGNAGRTLPNLISTFSIVAADPATGQVGVAVQSKYFAVGAVVPWARAGVGAVATQALGWARYGPALLEALEAGKPPQAALEEALTTDPLAAQRQVGVVHADGEAANHTGAKCNAWAGGRTGPGFSVQGNILVGEEVIDSMAGAFTTTTGDLAERLMASLEAGQAAGGDRRGQQSAVLLVEQRGYRDLGMQGIDRLVDLRVDDHPEPITELRRLFGLWQRQEALQQGMLRYNKGDFAAAADTMTEANTRFPGNATILYNLACFESLSGRTSACLTHLGQAVALEASFRDLAKGDSDFDPVRAIPEFRSIVTT